MINITTDNTDFLHECSVIIGKKEYGVLAVAGATVFKLNCPACESNYEKNEIATLENGQYLYICNHCGLFTHCEVTQVVTGD